MIVNRIKCFEGRSLIRLPSSNTELIFKVDTSSTLDWHSVTFWYRMNVTSQDPPRLWWNVAVWYLVIQVYNNQSQYADIRKKWLFQLTFNPSFTTFKINPILPFFVRHLVIQFQWDSYVKCLILVLLVPFFVNKASSRISMWVLF